MYKLIKEYSYGAVVYKIKNNRIYYLIEWMGLGHVSLPKGHIEKGESKEDCAKREVYEETGLIVELDTSFEKTVTYSPYYEVVKDVTFYLAKPLNNSIHVDNKEVLLVKWLTIEEALEVITYDTDKEVLLSANSHILKCH